MHTICYNFGLTTQKKNIVETSTRIHISPLIKQKYNTLHTKEKNLLYTIQIHSSMQISIIKNF